MNIQEFAALKVGDKIANGMSGGAGTVVQTLDTGVRVVWGERSDNETLFYYSVNSTAWMHWNKMEKPEVPPAA